MTLDPGKKEREKERVTEGMYVVYIGQLIKFGHVTLPSQSELVSSHPSET